jgi:SAM-dependent methyltransferase
MHSQSYEEMDRNVRKYLGEVKGYTIVDIGSYDVYGTYKPIFHKENQYIGVDLQKGPNVDQVMPDEFTLPLESGFADLIICGQTLEHCRNPFKLVAEMRRVIRGGRYVFLVAPFLWRVHRYPVDCFRFLPDGMKALLEESGFIYLDSYLNEFESSHVGKCCDCWGIGKSE